MIHGVDSGVFALQVWVEVGTDGSRYGVRGDGLVRGGCAVRVDWVVCQLSLWESHRGSGKAMRAVGRRGDAVPRMRQVADVGGW